MKELVQITITGQNQKGLTAEVAAILSGYGVRILDIGQKVMNEHYSLGLLVELPAGSASSGLLKELLFRTHAFGLQIAFTPVAEAHYREWSAGKTEHRWLLTLLARTITAEHLERTTALIRDYGLGTVGINRLSGRLPLEEPAVPRNACVEFVLRGKPTDEGGFRKELLEITNELGVDIAFQEDSIYRRHRRMVVFDMDSTLITSEVIDELAIEAGVGEEVAAITEQAMRGEIDFDGSLQRRVSLLQGVDEGVLAAVAQRLKLTEGAETLFANLQHLGFRTAILSGGFTYFGHFLQQKLKIDYVYANTLEIENNRLTGRVSGRIVNGARKAALLDELARKENISLEQVIAVGDGANDLPMLGKAGLGIAFRAKPVVRQRARQAISTLGLDAILYLMGLRDHEQLPAPRPAR